MHWSNRMTTNVRSVTKRTCRLISWRRTSSTAWPSPTSSTRPACSRSRKTNLLLRPHPRTLPPTRPWNTPGCRVRPTVRRPWPSRVPTQCRRGATRTTTRPTARTSTTRPASPTATAPTTTTPTARPTITANARSPAGTAIPDSHNSPSCP